MDRYPAWALFIQARHIFKKETLSNLPNLKFPLTLIQISEKAGHDRILSGPSMV